ncbi:MAG: hypothetical protein V3V92_03615 [Candidatus Hydrothermarchaeales archaeon]
MRKKLDMLEKIKQISQEGGGKNILRPVNAEAVELPEPTIEEPDIKDFELELPGLRTDASVVDRALGERLDQILVMESGSDVKWTATVDAYAEKFASMVREGLTEIKTRPPIYGVRFQESSLLVSHMNGYTFTLASYQTDFDKLVEIFTTALNKARDKLGP